MQISCHQLQAVEVWEHLKHYPYDEAIVLITSDLLTQVFFACVHIQILMRHYHTEEKLKL